MVLKGFTQSYGVDYFETLSLAAKLKSVKVILSVAANFQWPPFQLDIKIALFYGDLQEEVYTKLPPVSGPDGLAN